MDKQFIIRVYCNNNYIGYMKIDNRKYLPKYNFISGLHFVKNKEYTEIIDYEA